MSEEWDAAKLLDRLDDSLVNCIKASPLKDRKEAAINKTKEDEGEILSDLRRLSDFFPNQKLFVAEHQIKRAFALFREGLEQSAKELEEEEKREKGNSVSYIKGYKLVATCGGCPEQYDVFKGENIVGYLRLRHGDFDVYFPNVNGNIIYTACPKGDGEFDELERQHFLSIAIDYIEQALTMTPGAELI